MTAAPERCPTASPEAVALVEAYGRAEAKAVAVQHGDSETAADGAHGDLLAFIAALESALSTARAEADRLRAGLGEACDWIEPLVSINGDRAMLARLRTLATGGAGLTVDRARYRIVPTASLKAGDPICNFFLTESAARKQVELAEASQRNDLCPELATAKDIDEADKWQFAVVPADETPAAAVPAERASEP